MHFIFVGFSNQSFDLFIYTTTKKIKQFLKVDLSFSFRRFFFTSC